MAEISQLPPDLDLIGLVGSPFALTVDVTLPDGLVWSDVTDIDAAVWSSPGVVDAAGVPAVVAPSDGVISVVWSDDVTTAMGPGVWHWQLSAVVDGSGPFGLLAGTLRLRPAGTSGASTPAAADLTVAIGAGDVSLDVAIGGVAAGADGKTVRNGTGAPSSGLGVDGDFYIDTTADAIYGPKTAGAWGSSTSLIGPTGATGAAGDAGADGAAGAQGPQGDPGEGVPTGGAAGQVLTKDSGADYDTSWQDAGGGSPLTYPTFTWDHYDGASTGLVVGGGTSAQLPLDTSDGAVVSIPPGWSVTNPSAGVYNLNVPAGLYAVTWYWEDASGSSGAWWDNYIVVRGADLPIFPTAPMAYPGGYWGSASAVVKLTHPTTRWFAFPVLNNDASPQAVYNTISVIQLDA